MKLVKVSELLFECSFTQFLVGILNASISKVLESTLKEKKKAVHETGS